MAVALRVLLERTMSTTQSTISTTTADGNRVYNSIPDGLIPQWDHVQIEAAMRSKLPQAQEEAARLKDDPKTYQEIQSWLHDLEGRIMVDGLLHMMFGVQQYRGP